MKKVIKVLLWSSALMPLLVDTSVFFPYVSGGNFLLRTVIFITSISFLIHFISNIDFRNEIISKLKSLIKNPLFIALISFFVLLILSTIFAFDKYIAFWGNLERSEGLVGMIYFFSFFIFSLLVFEKKDWITFFKVNLVITLILLVKAFSQYLGGNTRPGAYLDNPSYLAGYLMFSIIFSLVTLGGQKSKTWNYVAIGTGLLSVFGIFLTQTRSTILGLFVGLVAVLLFGIFTKTKYTLGKVNIKKTSIIILAILVIFSALFLSTKSNPFWKSIPGVARITDISFSDSTTNTRLMTQKLSIEAMNPKENGFKNFFIGYGIENFGSAYAKYFNPDQFNYEMKWFDRSHNKYLDVLVMNGVLGILIYLAIFVLLFRQIRKTKDSYLTIGGLIFGLTAYLVHLFFIFDQTMTYLFIFTIFAFVIGYQNTEEQVQKENTKKSKIVTVIIFSILTVFISFVYLRNDLTGYIQMKDYTRAVVSGKFNNLDRILFPITTAQREIRINLLEMMDGKFDQNNQDIFKISNQLSESNEKYFEKNNKDYIFLLHMATNDAIKGRRMKDLNLIKKSEDMYRKVLDFMPKRPEVNYGLAINLFFQNRIDESFDYFEKAFSLNEKYFEKKKESNEKMYRNFVKYFYDTKNKEKLIIVTERLRKNNFKDIKILDQIIEYINKQNIWPNVGFGN